MEKLQEIDGEILLWIQDNLRISFLNPVIKFITSFGNSGLIWIGIIIVLLAMKKYRYVGIVSAASLISRYLISNVILKNLVQRVRPYEVVEGLTSLVGKMHDSSFPSGHASSSIAVAVVLLALMPKKVGIPCMALALLICFSRLYVGVHYPTDVLAGMIIAFICALISIKIADKIRKSKAEQ